MKTLQKAFRAIFAVAAIMILATSANADLVGFYTFANDLTDSSGNGNNGTAGNAGTDSSPSGPTIESGTGYQGGNAALFTAADNGGLGDSFAVPINLSPFPNATIGGWFQFTPNDQDGGIHGIISADTGNFQPTLDIDTRFGTPGEVSAFIGGGGLGSGIVPTPGQWLFIAVSYNQSAGTANLYVGNSSVSATTSFTPNSLTTLTIGRNPNFDTPFDGLMSDVFVYNTALTGNQIADIESGGAAEIVALGTVPEPTTMVMGGMLLLPLGMSTLRMLRRSRTS